MKSTIIKSLALFAISIFTLLVFKDSNAGVTAFKGATCPITINFCVSGAGSGVQITIYDTDVCQSPILTVLTTNSSGCASYTFVSGCEKSFAVRVSSCDVAPECRYLIPDNIGNNGTFQVAPCP